MKKMKKSKVKAMKKMVSPKLKAVKKGKMNTGKVAGAIKTRKMGGKGMIKSTKSNMGMM
jgi:hypothetical protein